MKLKTGDGKYGTGLWMKTRQCGQTKLKDLKTRKELNSKATQDWQDM